MTTKQKYVKSIVFACLIILLFFMTGCNTQTINLTPSALPPNTPLSPTAIPATPTTIPHPPLSADEVKTIAAEFDKVSSAHMDAWNKHDRNLMVSLYTSDITYHEDGIEPMRTGQTSVLWLQSYVLQHWPDQAVRSVDTFIGREDGFDVVEIWNWNGSTKENPFTGYSWYTLRNGRISDMWLFWGSDVFKRLWTPGETFDQKPLQDYASAWSSGDLATVADLYATDVVRQDTLYGENQQGSSAVNEFAAEFFAWYPGVRLELLQPFKLDETGMTGGVYAIHVIDQAGKPCDVRAVILLELAEDKITKEWMFYNADSLIACGWAQ